MVGRRSNGPSAQVPAEARDHVPNTRTWRTGFCSDCRPPMVNVQKNNAFPWAICFCYKPEICLWRQWPQSRAMSDLKANFTSPKKNEIHRPVLLCEQQCWLLPMTILADNKPALPPYNTPIFAVTSQWSWPFVCPPDNEMHRNALGPSLQSGRYHFILECSRKFWGKYSQENVGETKETGKTNPNKTWNKLIRMQNPNDIVTTNENPLKICRFYLSWALVFHVLIPPCQYSFWWCKQAQTRTHNALSSSGSIET